MWKEYQLKIDDLKQENMYLKKRINELMSNININKVQIRKLESECKKKDKEIYFLMDPKNSNCKIFQQGVCENGANFIIRLKRENEKLRNDSTEKDMIIKRLNAELKATNVYLPLDKDKRKIDGEIQKKIVDVDSVVSEKVQLKTNLEIAENETNIKQDNLGKVIKSLECKELEKLYSNLQKIKENLRHNVKLENGDNNTIVKMYDKLMNNIDTARHTQITDSTLSSCEFEFSCDTPHEEIQKLENYFVEMFTEVDDLKLVIHQLQKEQEKISQLCLNERNLRKIKQQKKIVSGKKLMNSTNLYRKNGGNSVKAKYQSINKETTEYDSDRSSIKSDFNVYSNYVEISQDYSKHCATKNI